MRLSWNKSGFSLLLASVAVIILGFQGCKKDPKVIDGPFVRFQGDESVLSKIYNRAIGYSVLLPDNYNTSTESYPVVYLLHGYGDDQTSWYKYGLVKFYSDMGAAENGPMIFVMPLGYNSYYVNRYNGTQRYMDFFTTELVPHIDSVYRTKNDKAHRAVMGYSMGGYGALILPSKNPDIFQTGVVLSMSFRTDSQYVAEPQWVFDSQWGPIFGGTGAEGNARLTDYFLEYSPLHFFSNQGGLSFTGLNLYIDCGDDEETLSETNGSLHNVLRDLNIPHEYRMMSGGHSWDYWHKELPEALKYIGFAFQQIPYPSEPDAVDPGPAIPSDRIISEQLQGTGLSCNIVLPSNYAEGTDYYPLVIILHDRDVRNREDESQKLFSLLTKKMAGESLPNSLLIEIPEQSEALTNEMMHDLISQLGEKYRCDKDLRHTIMLGNQKGGRKVYELMTGCSDICKAFLLFDAELPDDAADFVPDAAYYLDISENGLSYKGYHSLYMSMRKNQLSPEYRVRQGTPSHDAFLNGLDKASGFINDHLKY